MPIAGIHRNGLLSRLGRRVDREFAFVRRRFVAPSPPFSSGAALRLHIGCGEINSPHFMNIDAQPFPHVHVVSNDILHLPQFLDGCADMIYMCHVLEHVPRKSLDDVVCEMGRVLKTGGILRLSVPDFDLLLAMYEGTGRDVTAIADPLLGSYSNRYDVHYAVFNRDFLTQLLLRNGFREVRVWDPFQCEFHDFEDWASKSLDRDGIRYPVSLNLEGVK